jgi:hypothetical protein
MKLIQWRTTVAQECAFEAASCLTDQTWNEDKNFNQLVSRLTGRRFTFERARVTNLNLMAMVTNARSFLVFYSSIFSLLILGF